MFEPGALCCDYGTINISQKKPKTRHSKRKVEAVLQKYVRELGM